MSENKIDRLKIWLNEQPEIELALLFGSYANASQQSNSDLDLAIQTKSKTGLNAEQKLSYLEQLNILLEVEIDLIDLHNIGQPLLSQIMKYGKQLKGDNNIYAELAVKSVNSAQDFIPYIKRMLAERRELYIK